MKYYKSHKHKHKLKKKHLKLKALRSTGKQHQNCIYANYVPCSKVVICGRH